ncbi:MAG: hypothetical protein FWE61_04925, partial [Micrococcales bacterium]|nr:hypothetical protein [Micrococcales bacterium]
MDNLVQRVDAWHQASQHKKIIKAVESVPADQRGDELTGLLARARINTGNNREALRLLESLSPQAQNTWVWCFRMGVVLVELECGHEAVPYLERCLALGGPAADVDPLLARARDNVAERHAHVEEVCATVAGRVPPGPSPQVLHLLFTQDEGSARAAVANIEAHGYSVVTIGSAKHAGFRGMASRRSWVVEAVDHDVLVSPE